MNAITTTMTTALPPALLPEAEQAAAFIRARHADATRRAYATDAMAFGQWAADRGLQALPASPEVVAAFLADQAQQGRKPATLVRRLAGIRFLHREAGLPTPTDAELVKATMAGIRRTVGAAQRQAAPATVDRLAAMLAACGDDLLGKRDRALLVLGFGGALRRSELVALRVEDIELCEQGLRLHIRRAKTDQEGRGAVVPVLDGPRLCVKDTLSAWLQAAGISSGPVFRGVGRGGVAMDEPLTDRSVANAIKRLAKRAGLPAEAFSGHSLRAGFLTSAAAAGADVWQLMEVSRHRRVETLRGYVRQAQEFSRHAGAGVM